MKKSIDLEKALKKQNDLLTQGRNDEELNDRIREAQGYKKNNVSEINLTK